MKRGTIAIEGSEFVVECPPHVSIKLRRVFAGSQRRGAGVFKLSATAAIALELEWFRQRHPLDLVAGSENEFNRLVAKERRRQASIAELDDIGYVPREFKLAIPAREYQRVAADLAIRTRNLLIADELGLGKTVSAICALASEGALPAVVVTMTHLPLQWEKELGRFAPKLRVHRVRSGKPYRFQDIKFETNYMGLRRAVVPRVPDVIIINYHKLNTWVETLAAVIKSIVFDEIQELRHAGTLKYDAAIALSKAADMRIGLSATPIYNYGAEIYSVIDSIAPGQLGTRREFYDEWCGGVDPGSKQDARKVCVSDPVALGAYLRESGMMIRRTRKEVGRELPPLTVVRHVVDVDATRIDEVSADVAELAQRVLARTGTSFEMMKWSGEIDYRMRQATGIGKAAGVVDFVRLLVEAGEKIVLYGWHHEVYAIWRSLFDKHCITFAMYTGDQSETEKVASVKKFSEGDAQVLIISLRSGAGLDGLQFVSRTVVIGELDWSPQVMHQDIGRVYRDGQPEPCAAYYLVADEGSDPIVADALGLKEAQSTGIVDPDKAGSAHLVGASADHVRKLAIDILTRRGIAIPKPADPAQPQTELSLVDARREEVA